MDEPIEIQPAEPSATDVTRGRRPWRLIFIIMGVLGVLVLAGGLGSRALYSGSFDSLVASTREAEGAQVWRDFFIAQDCFIDAVVEAADAELAFNEGLTLIDETDLLARHVTLSLASFADLSVLPFHRRLAAARDSIVAHYEVWDGHLGESVTTLAGLDPDPAQLAAQFQAWVDVVVGDSDAIESTFNDAEAAFQEAARDDASRQEIDSLFTPSDVACSRDAV